MANTTPPTITLTTDKSLLKAGDTALITMMLSEVATDFVLSDIRFTGGTLSNFSGSGKVYSASFTPYPNSTAQGSVCVENFKFSDAAGNANEDGADPNNRVYFVIDTLVPTISISSSKTNLGLNETPAISFSLSEPSTDFDLSDISVTGGTLGSFKGSGTSYTAVLKPTGTTDIVISVSGNSFTDHAGNANTGFTDLRFPYDTSKANVAWTRLLGTSGSETANALTTGTDGSVYVAGNTNATLNGQVYSGNGDGFVAKYSPDGTRVWTSLLATNREESISAIATGIDGSIYVSGSTNGPLDMETNSGAYDAFVVKYNPDGTKVWTRLMGNGGGTFANALAIDLEGAIYVGGSASGRLALDGQWFNRGEGDAFISKYNPDGTKLWTRGLGTGRYDSINAITIGLDGSVYASGETGASLDGQPFNSSHFLTKFSPDGTQVWTRMLGSSLGIRLSNFPNSLTTGLDGAIYICGYTESSMDQQPFSKGQDAFITKYNTDGTKIWTLLLGSDRNDLAYALTTGLDGSIYVSGTTDGALEGQTALGSHDIFVTKYKPDGTKVWTLQTGTTTYDYAYALTTGLDESIYVSGSTYGMLDGNTNNGAADAFIFKLSIPDTSAPQIHISSNKTSLDIGETSSLTLTLSKPSSNFVASDIAVQGGTLSNFQGSAAIYTATFTAGIDGSNGASVSVGNGKFSDALGIFNSDGADSNNKVSFTVKPPEDTTPPTITVTASASSILASQNAVVTFKLSESSTNFTAADVIVIGGTMSNFTGSGTAYSATFTLVPNSNVNGAVTVSNGVFTDAAGNANADGSDTNNSFYFTRIPTITKESHLLSVIVDKNVLGPSATLLKTLKESITYTNGQISNHSIEFNGSTYDYSQIDAWITTVTRDAEFTSEFTKEINEHFKSEVNITYTAAVLLVGFASIDSVILSIAGSDGNFVG